MSKKIIGDVMLKRLYLRKLPEILRDLIIDGKFSCSDNNLLSNMLVVTFFVETMVFNFLKNK